MDGTIVLILFVVALAVYFRTRVNQKTEPYENSERPKQKACAQDSINQGVSDYVFEFRRSSR